MSNAAFSSLALLLLVLAAPVWGADPGTDAASGTDTGGDTASDGDNAAGDGDPDVRDMAGTSIIGNRELPKSLYIVPWKNSEVGLRTDLSRELLDEGLNPVDPNEFERQVDYYQFHHQQQ